MGHDTDVNAQTDAIQDHDVEVQTSEQDNVDTQVEEQQEEKPAFISRREEMAAEMLARQREERNDEIARELGYERHPEINSQDNDDTENINEGEKDTDVNNEEQEETISNETNEDIDKNTSTDTEIDNGELNQSPQDVDQNKDNDLKLNKPGFYGEEVLLKIDGQLVKMPTDKALSILQKNQSADKRLENVVLRERQLTLREQQLQQQNRPQPSEPQKPDVVNNADIEKRARTIVQSVEDGEQEKAVESLVALVTDTVGRQSTQTEPTLTPDQIAQLVDQRSKAMEATSVESHLKASGSYDDVFNDQTAYGLAIQNVQTLSAQGFEGSTEQLMTEAIEMVRDWRTGLSRELRLEQQNRKSESEPKPKPKQSKISEPQRLEKKRDSARPVKSTTTIQRPVKAQPEAEPSELDKRRSIFDKVKAARGQ